MYSVTIEVPSHILPTMKDRPRPVLVKFKSQEEKDAYVQEESKKTKHALHELASAMTIEQRSSAYLKLYHARKAYSSDFLKILTDKESA